MNLLRYTIRRAFKTIHIIVIVLFLTLIMTFNMPENPFVNALGGEGGLYKPYLFQFYNYSTVAIGLMWTRFIFVYIGGYITFAACKVIRLGFGKIHIMKNLQKMAEKKGITVK